MGILTGGLGIFLIVVLIFGFAIFGAWLASEKGRNGVIWFFLTLVFGLPAFLAIGFAPSVESFCKEDSAADDETGKKSNTASESGATPAAHSSSIYSSNPVLSDLAAAKAEMSQDSTWVCKKCGATNPDTADCCKDCGAYK
jgi:ribosomal protein L40E